MILELEEHLRHSWSMLGSAKPAPKRVHFLKYSHDEYPEPLKPLLLLAFPDMARIPVAAFKVSREPEGDVAIHREAEFLETMHRLLPSDLARPIPRLLRQGLTNERPFIMMTIRPGAMELHNTWSLPQIRSVAAHIESALGWALDAALTASSSSFELDEWMREEDTGNLFDEMQSMGWEGALQEELKSRLHESASREWPAAAAHGDFFPGNVLFQGGSLSGVIDWGTGLNHAPIFHDVLTYELSFALGDPARLGAVATLQPFVSMRRRLLDLGIPTHRGEPPRLVTLMGLHRDARRWGRPQLCSRYLQLMREEIQPIK